MEFVAIGLSVIALVVSVLAWRETKRQADAAESEAKLSAEKHRLEEVAARSADLVAVIARGPKSRSLVVRNHGRAVARGADLAVEVPLGEQGNLPGLVSFPFPCDVPPGPDGEVPVGLLITGGTARHLQIAVTWTDGEGAKEYRALLSI